MKSEEFEHRRITHALRAATLETGGALQTEYSLLSREGLHTDLGRVIVCARGLRHYD